MQTPTFEIHISTKNRRDELLKTLSGISGWLERGDTSCVVFDDGSTDGTFESVQTKFPAITLRRNEQSKGYLYCRNAMLNQTQATFAISLDDDANFASPNPLETIGAHFASHPDCGLIACRIFWGKQLPDDDTHDEVPYQVNSYVGCGHAWRVSAWRQIPSYPEWFEFYGEENFASFQLFKKGFAVHYVPDVFVHHRVEILERRAQKDYTIRLRRSLRSGWYLYFLFLPKNKIAHKMAYSVWNQLRLKVFKGDFKALQALLQAAFDFVTSAQKIRANTNRLTAQEHQKWVKIPEARIYWKPKRS